MLNLFTRENVAQSGELREKLATTQAMADHSPVNIMLANTDLVITYMNATSLKTLRSIQHLLPCKPEDVVGKSVDLFHRQPERQRQLLADPKNLPHRAVIQLANERLDLLVSPLFDESGKYLGPMVTWDVVTEKLRMQEENLDFAAQIAAIQRNMAVIEFAPDGTILTANELFLRATGYTLRELQGQHHRLFCDPAFAASPAYSEHWSALSKGQELAGQYQRVAKGGREIWLQASYNPIVDKQGKVTKVVKLATDITTQVQLQREADERKQRDAVRGAELQQKVDQLLQVVSAAAAGDLSQRVPIEGTDAIGQLATGIQSMLNDLQGVIGQVVEGAAQFAEGAQVISESSQSLAHGSQSQSEAVDRINNLITSLNGSIAAVSESAADASRLASETSHMAAEGGAAVNKSIEAMGLIQYSSQQIGEITRVISEIASQTNMLALNAAIEAARAGEHGLGFAVVADEVRKLAERSGEAARQISQLIRESTQRVTDGAQLNAQAGEALTRIITGVETTSQRIANIAASTQQQAGIARDVSSGIASVTGVTEQLAAASEELASSSEELGAQAMTLREIVARFSVA